MGGGGCAAPAWKERVAVEKIERMEMERALKRVDAVVAAELALEDVLELATLDMKVAEEEREVYAEEVVVHLKGAVRDLKKMLQKAERIADALGEDAARADGEDWALAAELGQLGR